MSNSPSREETLFDAALGIPDPEARAAYIAQACGTDVPLRQAVEALLRVHSQPCDFLEHPLLGPPAASSGEAEPSAPGAVVALAERPGDRIGPYKLLERLGEGGCGEVYMAEQAEPIRRRVALKVVKLGMDTRAVIARFEAERQALALMDHPNIARVFDAGATATGRPYFVMELVRGISITDYCDQNELPTRARLDLFSQVCQAIQHAHQKGIIHRDIKPSNILVTLHDGVPVPKVIDFGIAKATGQQRLTDKTVFTAFRQFIGTPAYMSPEQAEMSGLDIDTRSDIYSLGVLLYELLTGRTPFPEKELLAAGLDEMRRTIRERQPPKPSTRLSTMLEADRTTVAKGRQIDPAKLIHLLRGDLDWIVMKCLEKNRNRRYATANGLAADLQRHLNHEPVVARPPSRIYSFRKMVSRNKAAFAAITAVAASLLVGLGLSNWLLIRERAARDAARKEADKSRDVEGFLKEMLNGVTPAVAKGKEVVLLQQILDKTAERVSQRLAKDPEVMADLQTAIGQVYSSLGEYARAESILNQAVATRRRIAPNSLALAESLDSLTMAVWKLGRLQDAEQAEREALALRVMLLTTNSQEAATSLNNLGVVFNEEGKLEDAQAVLEGALAIQRGLPTKDEGRIAETLNALSSTAWKKRQFQRAEELDREALAIYRKLWDDLHPDVALALNNLGTVLNDEGKFEEAIAVHRRALKIQKTLFAHEHDDMATTLHNLAQALWNNGALKEAEETYRELLVVWPKLRGPDCREYAMTLNNLGTVLANQGRLPEAETLHQQALEIQQSKHFDADVPSSLNNLATVLLLEKKPSDAEPLFGKTIVLLRQRGNRPTDLATCLRSHAVVLRDLGRLEQGERAIRDCLSLCQTEPSLRDDWRKYDAMSVLGGVLVLRTNYDQAEPQLLKGNSGLLERAAAVPAGNKPRLKQTFERLVKLYEARGAPDQAAAWRQKLAEFETAQEDKASPAK